MLQWLFSVCFALHENTRLAVRPIDSSLKQQWMRCSADCINRHNNNESLPNRIRPTSNIPLIASAVYMPPWHPNHPATSEFSATKRREYLPALSNDLEWEAARLQLLLENYTR